MITLHIASTVIKDGQFAEIGAAINITVGKFRAMECGIQAFVESPETMIVPESTVHIAPIQPASFCAMIERINFALLYSPREIILQRIRLWNRTLMGSKEIKRWT